MNELLEERETNSFLSNDYNVTALSDMVDHSYINPSINVSNIGACRYATEHAIFNMSDVV